MKMIFTFVCRNCATLFRNSLLQSKRLSCNCMHRKYNYLNKNCLYYIPRSPKAHSFLSTSALVNNVHTTKGWKVIARTGQKKNEHLDPEEYPISCEEGTDAIHHSALLDKLQNCKSVAEQIETFCSIISITPEDMEKRNQFCISLVTAFKPYFRKFKVHQFGSSINGLGFKGCDIDVSIQTIFDGQDYLKDIKEIPSLDSVLQGNIPAETVAHLPPRFLLRFIRRIIRQHCSNVKEPILLIKARCPILRFYDAKYNIYCDFSCENQSSLCNTKLIRLISLLDERFKVLAKLIRYWGKYGGFVGDIDMFNSYAFSLLVVHFLQQTFPPVIPPISEIIEKSDYLNYGEVSDSELLLKDLKKFQPSKNIQSVEQLLRDFFFYYLNFDYANMMMPLNSSIMPKKCFASNVNESAECFEFSPITVQDPFRPNFNTTHAAAYKTCKKFLNGIVEACKMYQRESVWISNSEIWGICSLFHKPMSENEMNKTWQTNRIQTITLPSKANEVLLKEILEKCLLFECNELHINQENPVHKPYIRYMCKVYQNTWQGRDWINKTCQLSFTNHVDKENWISKEVTKRRGDDKACLLFTFYCEIYKNASNNELNVVLSFKDSKCSPVIAVFLKDYIPYTCEKLIA